MQELAIMDYGNCTIDIVNIEAGMDSEQIEAHIVEMGYKIDQVNWMVADDIKVSHP